MICMVCQTDQSYRNGKILTDFFTFLYMNILLDMKAPFLKLSTFIENILMQENVFQIFYLSKLRPLSLLNPLLHYRPIFPV